MKESYLLFHPEVWEDALDEWVKEAVQLNTAEIEREVKSLLTGELMRVNWQVCTSSFYQKQFVRDRFAGAVNAESYVGLWEKIRASAGDGSLVPYQEEAVRLMYEPEVLNIKTRIIQHYEAELKEESTRPASFIVIGAPSGAGKTQMSFNLRCFPGEVDVLHICLAPGQEKDQNVYRHPTVARASEAVRGALYKDGEALRHPAETHRMLSALEIMDNVSLQLHTIALICSCFGLRNAADSSIPTTAAEVHAALRARRNGWPVVVVDEALERMDGDDAKFTFHQQLARQLRAIFRACKVMAIYMGTSTNSMRFINFGKELSRGTSEHLPWAYFVGRLPRTIVDESSVAGVSDDRTRRFLELLIARRNVNPLILTLLIQKAHSLQTEGEVIDDHFLDCLLAAVSRELFDQKRLLHSTESGGMRAQVMFLLNGDDSDVSRKHAWVHAYFARFPGDEQTFTGKSKYEPIQVKTEGPREEYKEWLTAPAFPTCGENPALPLLLSGPCVPGLLAATLPQLPIPHTPPFQDWMANMTYTSAAALVKSLVDGLKAGQVTFLPIKNANALKRSGDVLECIGALCWLNASAAGGVGGIPFHHFLRFLITEAQPLVPASGQALPWADDSELSKWVEQSVYDKLMPRVCRVGDAYPEELRAECGMHLANYHRPPDSVQNDGVLQMDGSAFVNFFKVDVVEGDGSLEGKNRDEATGGKVATEVISSGEKIAESDIQIVLCSSVASIRSDPSTEDTSAVLAIVHSDTGCIHLTGFGGGGPRVRKRIAVFIECDEVLIRSKLGMEVSEEEKDSLKINEARQKRHESALTKKNM